MPVFLFLLGGLSLAVVATAVAGEPEAPAEEVVDEWCAFLAEHPELTV